MTEEQVCAAWQRTAAELHEQMVDDLRHRRTRTARNRQLWCEFYSRRSQEMLLILLERNQS